PHLGGYNERVRIAGEEASEAALVESFDAVEAARGDTPLTYFEYGTLGALWLFARERVEVMVLEVGLGGRLDAVNVIDADCAVLTSVGIDHVDYLGPDRESIGREKAGIFRAGRPAVIAEPEPPRAVLEAPGDKWRLGKDFGYADQKSQWSYWGPAGKRGGLAHPALRGTMQLRNAAAAMCAVDCLKQKLPLGMQDIRRGLAEVELPARFQVLPGRPQVVLDVAHSPQAAEVLAAVIVLPMVFDPEPKITQTPLTVRIPAENDAPPFEPQAPAKAAPKEPAKAEAAPAPTQLPAGEYVIHVGAYARPEAVIAKL